MPTFRTTGRVRWPRGPRAGPPAPRPPAKPSAPVPSEPPNLLRRAISLGRAMGSTAAAAVSGRQVWRSQEAKEACLAACAQCPSRVGASCLHCGCILRFKARLATEDCPHPDGSRWPPL